MSEMRQLIRWSHTLSVIMVYNLRRQATILAARLRIGSGQGAILQFLPCDDPSLLISAVLERYPASFSFTPCSRSSPA
jgi:hypothetical protein